MDEETYIKTDEYYGKITAVCAWPENESQEPPAGLIVRLETGENLNRFSDSLPRQYDVCIRQQTLPLLFLECGCVRNHDLPPSQDARRLVGSRLIVKVRTNRDPKNILSFRRSVTGLRAAPVIKDGKYPKI